jgi:hypothetical protein
VVPPPPWPGNLVECSFDGYKKDARVVHVLGFGNAGAEDSTMSRPDSRSAFAMMVYLLGVAGAGCASMIVRPPN